MGSAGSRGFSFFPHTTRICAKAASSFISYVAIAPFAWIDRGLSKKRDIRLVAMRLADGANAGRTVCRWTNCFVGENRSSSISALSTSFSNTSGLATSQLRSREEVFVCRCLDCYPRAVRYFQEVAKKHEIGSTLTGIRRA